MPLLCRTRERAHPYHIYAIILNRRNNGLEFYDQCPWRSHPCSLSRFKQGSSSVKIPKSSRTAEIYFTSHNKVIFSVKEPSDCLTLEQFHIPNEEVDELHVTFNPELPRNGQCEDNVSEIWKEVVDHLLKTFHPTVCYIERGDRYTWAIEDITIDLDDGRSYQPFWNNDHTILSFRQYVLLCLMLYFLSNMLLGNVNLLGGRCSHFV